MPLHSARLPSVPTIRTWPAKLTFFLLLRHDVLSCGAKRALHAVAFSLSRVSGVSKEKKKEKKLNYSIKGSRGKDPFHPS